MTLPSALQSARTKVLATAAPARDDGQQTGSAGRARAVALARRVVRRSTATARERVRLQLVDFVERQTAPVREQVGATTGRLDSLDERVRSLSERRLDGELAKSELELAKRELAVTTVNLELLKGEVRQVVGLIEDLGTAIAPATGIDGASARMSELRERLNGLDRRVRQLTSQPPAAGTQPQPSPPDGAQPALPPSGERIQSALFDYVGFERRFRGDPEVVVRTLEERYGALLADSPPVLDVGCGRAELLELLKERGVPALGVDTDPSMVAEARARGLEVHQQDAVSYLRSCPERSIGAIIATHVVEHLALDELIELLELSATRLQPGGVFIAETPNPQSLIVLGNSYLLDPTHVRPLHPSLLSFLCEGAGFRGVELRFFEPAVGYHLPMVEDPEAPAWLQTVNDGFRRLNEVLFGPQDFAVVARTAPSD